MTSLRWRLLWTDADSVSSAASEPLLSGQPQHMEPIDVEHTEYIIRTGELLLLTVDANLISLELSKSGLNSIH